MPVVIFVSLIKRKSNTTEMDSLFETLHNGQKGQQAWLQASSVFSACPCLHQHLINICEKCYLCLTWDFLLALVSHYSFPISPDFVFRNNQLNST